MKPSKDVPADLCYETAFTSYFSLSLNAFKFHKLGVGGWGVGRERERIMLTTASEKHLSGGGLIEQ